ncbi:UDP-glucose 4-epimerase GalE [Microbacterium sp. KHB019]
MRVLLTGGAGFIGSHTALALLEAGHSPLIVDDLSNAHPDSISRIAQISGVAIPALIVDVRDEAAVSGFLQEHGPVDAVIHLAGLKAVGESVAQPERYYDVNIGSTLALLRVMKKHEIHNLVFSSSATVYGASENVPHAEDAHVGHGISNPYGKTKHMIEEILRDVSAADEQLRITALRYFNPVGAHPSGLIGEDPRGVPNNLMPIVARVASGALDSVVVFGDDYPTSDGTGVRDYIHVQDLAQGHVRAAERALPGFEAINLGTGVPASVLDVIREYGAAAGLNIPYRVAKRRPGDIAVSYADVSKARAVLDWQAKRTLADACRDDWAWQQNGAKLRQA